MAVLNIGSTSLEYVERGAGPFVVLVHGSVSDYRTWQGVVSSLAPAYRVVAYSRRYHYPNPRNDHGPAYNVATHAKDLADVITTLDPAGAHVVGSSFGAYVALATALERPELVRSLVLGEPPILPLLAAHLKNPSGLFSILVHRPQAVTSFLSFVAGALRRARNSYRAGRVEEGLGNFVDGVLGRGSFAGMPEGVRAILMDNGPASRIELLGPGFPPFPVDAAGRCTIPTLLMQGDRSPAFFHAITGLLAGILPNADRATIPNASHSMHRDNPEAYLQAVREFLAKHSGNDGVSRG